MHFKLKNTMTTSSRMQY